MFFIPYVDASSVRRRAWLPETEHEAGEGLRALDTSSIYEAGDGALRSAGCQQRHVIVSRDRADGTDVQDVLPIGLD